MQKISATQMDHLLHLQDNITQARIRLVGQTTMSQLIDDTIKMIHIMREQGHFRMYNFQKLQMAASKYLSLNNEIEDIIQDNKIHHIPLFNVQILDHHTLQQITYHFQQILNERKFFTELNEVFEFFEISLFNFTLPINHSFYGQRFARLKSKRKTANYCGGINSGHFLYKSRWFVITSQGIGYGKERDFFHRKIREFNLYRNYMEATYIDINHFIILFQNQKYKMKFKYEQEMLLFLHSFISSYYYNTDKDRFRFDSFSQIHPQNQTVFYINGFTQPNYFNDLCDAIQISQRSIFITDWWLSPELFLKRPIENHPNAQLYKVLGQAARRGVQVFVLIYKESPFALPNDSDHAQKMLMSESENITVIRHPDKFIFFWSHHEKMTLIDNTVLFMGGLDLCFGRYEEPLYPLAEPQPRSTIWHGQDFNNPRIKDFKDVKEASKTLIDKSSQPRMPWRDQAIQVRGSVVLELAKHFRQYWDYANLQSDYRQGISSDLLKTESHLLTTEIKRFADILNFSNSSSKSGLHDRSNQLQHMSKTIQSQLKQQAKMRKRLYDDRDTIYLQPVFPLNKYWINIPPQLKYQQQYRINQSDFLKNFNEKQQKVIKDYQAEKFEYQRYVKFNDMIYQRPLYQHNHVRQNMYSNQQVNNTLRIQALRSASDWSIGLHKDRIEDSIYKAYQNLIVNSEKFIYIENQFFVSSTGNKKVLNMLVDLIAKRVIKAIQQRQKFLVFIFIPLLPGFAGDITARDGDLLRIQMELCLQTIYTGDNSLIKQVSSFDPNWSKYIKIFGLRNHALMQQGPVTEIVYIHSKLMIVDDRQMIVGSANLNDRSQLGFRDSELALIIEDENLSPHLGPLDNRPFVRSQQIMQHRINCMKSLFQVETNYTDIFNLQFMQQIERQVFLNDEFYWKVFKTYPHNNYKTLKEVRDTYSNLVIDTQHYMDYRYQVRGFVVPWPYKFLIDQPNFVNEFLSVGNTVTPTKIFA